MATPRRRSPLAAYLAMAFAAASVYVGFNLVSAPADRQGSPDGSALPGLVTPDPLVRRDFLTTVLDGPRTIARNSRCDDQGCCPTRRTTFGTSAPIADVVAAFEVQGYSTRDQSRGVVRTGPWPPARWVAERDYAGRWQWSRVVVAPGPDADRPEWPTVFTKQSIACGAPR